MRRPWRRRRSTLALLPRRPPGSILRALRLSVLVALLLAARPASAGGFGIGGLLMTEFPLNYTLRAGFGEMNQPGGWLMLELQPQRLARIGPELEAGQQSRPFGLRAGAFFIGDENFAIGAGFNAEGLYTGIPNPSEDERIGILHGHAGAELVVGLMPGGSRAPFLAMVFLGTGLGPDDQARSYGELQFIFPVPLGPMLLGIGGGIVVSSLKLRGNDLVTVTPALGIFPIPKG